MDTNTRARATRLREFWSDSLEPFESAFLKAAVREHWDDEACGTRYGYDRDRTLFFDQISITRYRIEPYIAPFAGFPSAKGKLVLEIGVGAGADFENWCNHATHATGIDLTDKAISLTRERLILASVKPQRYDLQVADAERLPFDDHAFDIAYSWGVLHHSPDTPRALAEAFRVLKPGGILKAMLYHVPSWVGLHLYLLHGLARGKAGATMKEVIFEHLESPGTKAFTTEEVRQLLDEIGFSEIHLSTKLGPGDLLTIKPSKKYDSIIYKVMWRLYPRWLVRRIGDQWGLNLLITAIKPAKPI